MITCDVCENEIKFPDSGNIFHIKKIFRYRDFSNYDDPGHEMHICNCCYDKLHYCTELIRSALITEPVEKVIEVLENTCLGIYSDDLPFPD